jgi:hypothetical protein
MASNSSTNPNVIDILFNNSIVPMLFSFLGIYVLCYLVFGVALKSENSAAMIHRAMDVVIFGILMLYVLLMFYNTNNTWKNTTTNIENVLNDPYTIVHTAIFIILFHILLFLFRIPLTGALAPYFVSLFLGGAWVVLIVSLIVWFFHNFLNVSLFDSNLWNDLTNSKPSVNIDINGNIVLNAGMKGNTNLKNKIDDNYDAHATHDEVFNISNNLYTYDDAKAVCTAYGARLATYDEVEEAYNKGGEWCNYGWSSDQMALFPTQKLTWYNLQRNPKHKNDCGRPGVNGGYMENPYIRFGVNCFGKKPAATDKDKAEMNANKDMIVPKTEEEIELDKKVQFWKENADKLLNINSFNRNKWSEY